MVAVPDDVFDEVATAHVMPVPGAKTSAEELIEWCKSQMSHFKVPKKILFHQQMPLLPNGKVDKIKLHQNSARYV